MSDGNLTTREHLSTSIRAVFRELDRSDLLCILQWFDSLAGFQGFSGFLSVLKTTAKWQSVMPRARKKETKQSQSIFNPIAVGDSCCNAGYGLECLCSEAQLAKVV